jgi:FkbM family methyltransferase
MEGYQVSRQGLVRNLKTRLKMITRSLLDDRVYTARRGLTRGLKRKGGFAFLPLRKRMTNEERFLTQLDLTARTVYDVGGGRGEFTLFFARAVGSNGKVITFEPNPVNYIGLVDQVRLNHFDMVEVRQIGLGRTHETAKLAFRPADPGRGSAHEHIRASTLRHDDAITIEVELDSLDNQVVMSDLPEPDLVKIDVEGLEFDVLQGMAETIKAHKPDIFVELHGIDAQAKAANARRVVDFLLPHGYSLFHVESENKIDATNAEIAKQGHLHCVAATRNLTSS